MNHSRFIKIAIFLIVTIVYGSQTFAQPTGKFADSIRIQYRIPALGYAVISSNSILEIQVAGISKINTSHAVSLNSKFRIGSNTKAITAFVAALLVKEKRITWNTKFFDLFPELKATSHEAYHKLTLLNLLSFRTQLYPYTYTDSLPLKEEIQGNEQEQQLQFTSWFLKQNPVRKSGDVHFSNVGYAAAALMLEKASGKSYKQLLEELGKQLDISFGFGNPNQNDSLQTWGHNRDLIPDNAQNDYKLNWLMAAGNIHLTLPDYCKFIQLQLQGLAEKSTLLSKQEFEFLHYGLKRFALGWFWEKDERNQHISYNIGNPGTFLSSVFIFKESDKAIIVFSNAQTSEAEKGIQVLIEKLKQQYIP